MIRISKNDYYMNIAKSVSLRSSCLRAQCGAIIVSNDSIISTGYNGNPRNQKNCCDIGICPRESYKPQEGNHLCNAVHGEMNCLINLARNGGTSCTGSTLYVYFKRLDNNINSYTRPCDNCWKHVLNAQIKRVVNLTIDKEKECLDITEIDNDGYFRTDRIKVIIKEVC